MQSITDKQRIHVVDFLRGISIVGILLVNMLDFHSPFLYLELDYWDNNLDLYTYALIDILAQGNFYPLFAFLFGFGTIILMTRAEQKGISFPVLFTRRMIFLLLLGIIHAFLIWHGDILITYAVCGLLLLLVYRLKGKTLLRLSVWLYTIPYGIFGLLILLLELLTPTSGLLNTDFSKINKAIEIYSSGTFTEIFSLRFNDWAAVNGPANMFFLFLSVFPCILAGMAFAKLEWLTNLKVHQKKLQIMFLVSLPIGLLLKMYPYLSSQNYATEFWQDIFGGPLLTLAIITGITLIYEQSPKVRKMAVPFVRLGRMSLTNYLMHSILCTLIFYSYGLGLYGEVGAFMGTLLAVLIILFQMVYTKYWLRSFRMGPIEYGWRIVTYWDKASFKREKVYDTF
ncbi:DUF418 domain-containing protein [Pradoshia sp. D12]|uniref:DUF418 domain-containing protein n=1 Tax=Bacillaceae TaxID=186817 RepID=UPI00080AE52F|nr:MULTISPECIES: DUF418 domain-containing protein [Bacillaceae]OCA90032.1 hypothetical protein A8L44_03650 [Bacillus sp. FJAT-27986]QFK70560.1 DUF418 domain-containing protein [Pradoshia sp. D12]TPF72356.1 DUF418 domain-containing protein [Bacillus sp. D12]